MRIPQHDDRLRCIAPPGVATTRGVRPEASGITHRGRWCVTCYGGSGVMPVSRESEAQVMALTVHLPADVASPLAPSRAPDATP